MSIKISPINIEVTNDFKYEIVAVLVDREDFLEDISKIRKDQPVSSYETVRKIIQSRLNDVNYAADYFDQGHIVASIMKKYKKDYNFHEIIWFAIFAGIVTDQELSNFSYLHIINPKSFAKLIELTDVDKILPMTAIVVHPEATETDILQTFREYKDMIKKQGAYVPDTISNIKRDRKWYWLNKEGLGYETISQRAKSESIVVSWSAVRAAIKQYKNRLTLSV